MKICWDLTKKGLMPAINFYRTRMKEPIIITRIKSSSNFNNFSWLFLGVVSSRLHASGTFFASCRTCKVLISTLIISVHLPWKPIKISPASRCSKEEISHKMCWIFHEALPILPTIRCPLKKNCVCLMKSLRNDAWEPRNGDSGRSSRKIATLRYNCP